MDHASHYQRQPGISPIRIAVYPKRRLSDLPVGLRTIPAEKPIQLPSDFSVTYVDFFEHGRLAPMASFRHVADEAATVTNLSSAASAIAAAVTAAGAASNAERDEDALDAI